MGSRTTVITTDQTRNDASQVQGLNAVRIEGTGNNQVTVTDADAIKNSLLFATANAQGTAQTYADVLGLTKQLATSVFQNTSDAATKQLTATTTAISDAYTKATGSVNTSTLLLGLGGIFALIFLMKGKG